MGSKPYRFSKISSVRGFSARLSQYLSAHSFAFRSSGVFDFSTVFSSFIQSTFHSGYV